MRPCRCTFFRKSPEWVVRSQLPEAEAGWTPARRNINPAGGFGGDVGKRWTINSPVQRAFWREEWMAAAHG